MRSSMFETKSLHSQNSNVDHSILIHGSTQIRLVVLYWLKRRYLMYLIEAEGLGLVCLNWALGISSDHFFTDLTSVIMFLSLGT